MGVDPPMSAPAALIGEDISPRDALGNSANPDKIANPDNLKYSERCGPSSSVRTAATT